MRLFAGMGNEHCRVKLLEHFPQRFAQPEKRVGVSVGRKSFDPGLCLADEVVPAAIPDEEPLAARSGSVGVPIPQAKESKAARKGQGRGEKTEG